MKKILFSVAMAFVLVSCAHDEVIEINRDGDEIQFNVVSDAATRAADVYCNNNMPKQFRVWANAYVPDVTQGAPYINGDLIVREGTGPYTWKNSVATRYWPAGELQFFAEVNAGDNYFWNAGDPYIVDYIVDTDVEKQNDLLYAVTDKVAKQEGAVTLNFRHALSQIVFQAKNLNPNIHVVIDEVKICNLANKGTINLRSATDGNIVNHDGTGDTAADRNGWTVSYQDHTTLAGGNTDYPVTFDEVAVPGDGDPYPLTSENDTDKEFSSNAMLLLPQTTAAWEPETGNAVPGADTQTGTYFLVKCKIYSVYDPEEGYQEDYEGDVCLYDDYAAIPASFNWSEGKKYIYTFVFDKDGNGGYDPTPEDPTEPEPVLTPITYDVTVDDFVPVANEDIKMETIE